MIIKRTIIKQEHTNSIYFKTRAVFQERPRPTFAALAPAVERNPITGLLEPYFPQEKRSFRMYSGIAIILGMVSIYLRSYVWYYR